MDTFVESGMTFGPFDDTKIFHIEKSKMLKNCEGIKTVEFIYHKRKYVLQFVEAKSSSPVKRPGNEQEYNTYLDEIVQKFEDSFQLYMAGILKRKSGYDQISKELFDADYQKMNFVFVLVINGHEKEWLPPLVLDIEHKMRRFQTIWNCSVVVLNDELAKEQHLIL